MTPVKLIRDIEIFKASFSPPFLLRPFALFQSTSWKRGARSQPMSTSFPSASENWLTWGEVRRHRHTNTDTQTHTHTRESVSRLLFFLLLQKATETESFESPLLCGKCSAALSRLSLVQRNVSGFFFLVCSPPSFYPLLSSFWCKFHCKCNSSASS